MKKTPNLTGQKFGRLTVTSRGENTKHGKTSWTCICECGKPVTVIGSNLRSGATASCGCIRVELASSLKSKGGIRSHPLYSVWAGIKKRCRQKTSNSYQYYGARGIKMCDRWALSFLDFVSDMGERPVDNDGTPYDIDRIDANKDYEPSNCRWLPRRENCSLAAKGRWERGASTKQVSTPTSTSA